MVWRMAQKPGPSRNQTNRNSIEAFQISYLLTTDSWNTLVQLYATWWARLNSRASAAESVTGLLQYSDIHVCEYRYLPWNTSFGCQHPCRSRTWWHWHAVMERTSTKDRPRQNWIGKLEVDIGPSGSPQMLLGIWPLIVKSARRPIAGQAVQWVSEWKVWQLVQRFGQHLVIFLRSQMI